MATEAEDQNQTPPEAAIQSITISDPQADVPSSSSLNPTNEMSLEEKYQIVRSVGEECILEDELRNLLDKKPEPICYDGFEPSGRMHIAQGVMKTINVNKLTSAGCRVKIWIADWFAQLNNKMGGDLKKIETVGRYLIEIWKAVGMDLEGGKVEFLWSSKEINSRAHEYWPLVMDIARRNKLPRIIRCSQIMGRSEQDELTAAQILYPCMQCADIFFLKADICQLGEGIAMPFVFDALLRRVGLKATLLAWAGASAAMTLPTLVFIKPRIPLHTQAQVQPLSFRFLRHTSFWMMQASVIIQSLGYLMPSTYLASYASNIGLPSITGPILLALFSVASVPGGIVHGMLGDKFSATKAVTIASIGSALPIWLLWGLSLDLANLVVFVIVYGFFAGGFSSTWSNMSADIQKDDSAADSALIFGMLMGGRGIGFVTAGPLSGALLQAKAHLSNEALGYATQYGPMIICTGVTAVFGAWAPMWKGMRVALGTCKGR